MFLALTAAVGFGISDFVGGVASRRVAALRVVSVSYPISVVITTVAALAVGGTITHTPMLWGALSGAASGLAVWWFYLALAGGPMSVVSPITAVLVAGIPVAVGVATGERPDGLTVAGIVLALIAVVLVSRESPDEPVADGHDAPRVAHVRFTPTVALFTAGSGIMFAIGFIALDRIDDPASGLWPLVASRLAATAVIWAVAVATGTVGRPDRKLLTLGICIAILDFTANTAILYAFNGGLLSVVSVIASLYPAATVVLATVVLGERVGPVQRLGMVMAFGAVGLIAAAG